MAGLSVTRQQVFCGLCIIMLVVTVWLSVFRFKVIKFDFQAVIENFTIGANDTRANDIRANDIRANNTRANDTRANDIRANNTRANDTFRNTSGTRLRLTVNHELGRLGNKMFEYASLVGIARKLNRDPFVPPYKSGVDMEKIFNLTHVMHDYPRTDRWETKSESAFGKQDPRMYELPVKDIKLLGYLQSWKYFADVEDEIRREFTFKPEIKQTVQKLMGNISHDLRGNATPVFIGVHVRSPDSQSSSKVYQAPLSYYVNAFNKMRTLLPGQRLVFLIAGNNLTWCKQYLAGSDAIVLPPAAPEIHMAVLASCDHVIISVGSYGWWAGWLAGGHVIYYTKFLVAGSPAIKKGFLPEDYYPPKWIAVDD